MVDPTHHWATYLYAFLISLMFTCAMGGFLPPKRDIRLAAGGLIMFVSWLLSLQIQRVFGFWDATSYLFIADCIWAYLFYLISRPSKRDTGNAVYERNWAGLVSLLHICMVILQISHLAITNHGFSSFGYIVLTVLLLVGWIIYRAFGVRWGLLFTIGSLTMTIAAIYKFSWALNILFGLSVLIVTTQGLKATKHNIQFWYQRAKATLARRSRK